MAAGAVAAAADAAATPATTSTDGKSLTVAPSAGLDPAGADVAVHGAGFDESKGIYVAWCVVNGPDEAPSPCGGGIDTAGASGSSTWLSSDPPPYGRGLAVPYEQGGVFAATIRVSRWIGDIDCQSAACAVVTRADHTRSQDRSQDVAVPVTFAQSGPPAAAVILALAVVAALAAFVVIRSRKAVLALALTLSVAVLGGCDAVGAPIGPPAATGAAACGPATAVIDQEVTPIVATAAPKLPVTVNSADGNSVTVTDVSRILPVNLYGSIAEIVFSLGLGDRVVGRDTSTTFEPAADLPLVTVGGHDLSAEAVLRLDPTVIVADASIGPPEVLDQLRAAGIPVVMVADEQTLEHVPEHIRTVAGALGVAELGEQLVERVASEIDAAGALKPADVEPPKVAFLYLRGSAGVYLIAGDGAGPDAMIEGIGAIDAGSDLGLSGFRPITSEALIDAAPDVILTMTDGLASVGGVDGLIAQPGVGQTPAGINRRIIDMDDGVVLNFGTRTGAAMTALANAVYRSC